MKATNRLLSDMTFDICKRMDAWGKSERDPEYTSSFLRDMGPTADPSSMADPSFGGKVNNATATTDVPTDDTRPKETPKEKGSEVVPITTGSSKVNPAPPIKPLARSEDHAEDGCGCPVSAALNSIKEEAEAADLYNKRANKVDDPHARAVYRDIAKEEVVHMGEAAELLREADPELAAEAPKGMEEAKGNEAGSFDIDKEIEARQGQ